MTESVKNLLTPQDGQGTLKQLFAMMAIAYLFSLAIRYLWIGMFGDVANYHWNDQLMINTNDGYYYAEGARDLLAGGHQENDYSPVKTPLSKLTAFLATVLPMSFETLILWMPALFGSLLTVPVILIGRALGMVRVGFAGALLAGIAWSYYNRTMIGYYDTDMLVIVFPTLIVWALIFALTRKRNRYLLLTTLGIIGYNWWYAGGGSLMTATAFMLLVYTLLFERKSLYNYKLLAFVFLGIAGMTPWLLLLSSLGLFAFFHFGKERADRFVYYILAASVALWLAMAGFGDIMNKLGAYVFREAVAADLDVNLKFFNVVQTVRESGQIPFEIFANRISGHPIVFFFSLAGTILMVLRYRVMLIALPMLGLGFLAYGIPGLIPGGGLRFTVYAVPIMALGAAFLIFLAGNQIRNLPLRTAFLVLATAGILYPNVRHVMDYKVPVVFVTEEVSLLDKLKGQAGREDYVVTWWDFGFPIRYYADVKTLIDGAKHSGKHNYAVSSVLTSTNPTAAANMARLDVEYTERNFREAFPHGNIIKAAQEYGFTDVNQFLQALAKPDFPLPEKTRDIYLYLPYRMLEIYPTVRLFSNMDIVTGNRNREPFYYISKSFRDTPQQMLLGNGIVLDKTKGVVQLGNNSIPLASFTVTAIDKQGKFLRKEQPVHPNGQLHMIFMQAYNTVLLMDSSLYNSLFIQMFALGKVDTTLFEPAIIAPMAHIYKLKR